MSGSYEKCGASTGTNARGYSYKCNKKSGHVDRGDKEHTDGKSTPAYRWKDKD